MYIFFEYYIVWKRLTLSVSLSLADGNVGQELKREKREREPPRALNTYTHNEGGVETRTRKKREKEQYEDT
jgi:hypothetical protein